MILHNLALIFRYQCEVSCLKSIKCVKKLSETPLQISKH